MKTMTVSGKTIEEAIRSGLSRWNVSEDRVKVQVLEHPSKGLFGFIGSKEAKVQLELLPDPIEEALQFVQDIIRSISLHVQVVREERGGQTVLHLTGPELGILIGRRGQTLDSLQYLVNIVANRYSDKHLRIVVDAEHFRERRTQTLIELSQRLADKVIRTGRDVVLEPMTPQERRIIHTHLQNHPQVRTFSKGEEPNRRIVITLK
ncbi:RNA-binding cell elongation regulator Jag/EloR [Marinicrinis lubricantis]|uniref:RNA-binding protein KhpB n=1 Tax=Marinicrinis lubricantis TaxID=2086470 RepID=A0ABW1IHM5_9BACL